MSALSPLSLLPLTHATQAPTFSLWGRAPKLVRDSLTDHGGNPVAVMGGVSYPEERRADNSLAPVRLRTPAPIPDSWSSTKTNSDKQAHAEHLANVLRREPTPEDVARWKHLDDPNEGYHED